MLTTTIPMIIIILTTIWFINAMSFQLPKANAICNAYLDRYIFGKITEVFDYHDCLSLRNWLGFRPWFYPYKMTDNQGNPLDI